LSIAGLRRLIERGSERSAALFDRLGRGLVRHSEQRSAALERLGQLLEAFSYRNVLARGFALVTGPDNAPVRSVSAVKPAMPLNIEFHDGNLDVVSTGKPSTGRKRKTPGPDTQGNLF
jgi:exodeoxyribonuclease VII large subunit